MTTLSAQVIDFQAFKRARKTTPTKAPPEPQTEIQAGWMPVFLPFGFFAAWPTFVWTTAHAFANEGQRTT